MLHEKLARYITQAHVAGVLGDAQESLGTGRDEAIKMAVCINELTLGLNTDSIPEYLQEFRHKLEGALVAVCITQDVDSPEHIFLETVISSLSGLEEKIKDAL